MGPSEYVLIPSNLFSHNFFSFVMLALDVTVVSYHFSAQELLGSGVGGKVSCKPRKAKMRWYVLKIVSRYRFIEQAVESG